MGLALVCLANVGHGICFPWASKESKNELLVGAAVESWASQIHAIGFAKENCAKLLIHVRKVNFHVFRWFGPV